jgi:hypothetical protein
MTSEKTLTAMDLAAVMAIEELSELTGKSREELLLDFMQSKTCDMLYDDKAKLWWDGPTAVAEAYEKEMSR